MTLIESARPRPEFPIGPVWREVDTGFWVASVDGMFLGTIEQHGSDRFFARDSARTYVGEWATLDLARAAVLSAKPI